jgi:hypothetical protein
MNKLLTTVALVAVVASPALAQAKHRAHRAHAQAPQASVTQEQQARRSFGSANNVYDIRGQYVGTDPDSRIRSQLANDPTQTGD